MTKVDWVRGDALGLDFPAHADALIAGGAAFLTRAFRASGMLSENNAVSCINNAREVSGGSTGRKMLLVVDYKRPEPNLHNNLFVKFSRDFDNRRRDAAKVQMELEVRFALLSQLPDFPVVVPACYFADFHVQTGTGILITQCIPFGMDGVEPQYEKGLDHEMPDQLGHYQALIRALARLAGSHKAGRLGNTVERSFPFDPTKLTVSARAPYTPAQIGERVDDYIQLATENPQLFPGALGAETFFARLRDEAPRFQSLSSRVITVLQSRPEMVALCHWNAHVDNAWFWRNDSGELTCGLMDWGNVSQMNVAVALWGCLSAAELPIWNEHFDDLLTLFISEFESCGGPLLCRKTLLRHLTLNVAMMGLAWMLDSPKTMLAAQPELAKAKSPRDALITSNEQVRSQLLILTAFLNLWERTDMNALMHSLEHGCV
ncbi:hypothetical protein [Litorivivens sp.]|uniref:hypothetical protein n=1 Tax=Litorivivens sp. TaxID=2020868 RepID=UPI0035676D21